MKPSRFLPSSEDHSSLPPPLVCAWATGLSCSVLSSGDSTWLPLRSADRPAAVPTPLLSLVVHICLTGCQEAPAMSQAEHGAKGCAGLRGSLVSCHCKQFPCVDSLLRAIALLLYRDPSEGPLPAQPCGRAQVFISCPCYSVSSPLGPRVC